MFCPLRTGLRTVFMSCRCVSVHISIMAIPKVALVCSLSSAVVGSSAEIAPFICLHSLVFLRPPTIRLFFSDQYRIQSKDWWFLRNVERFRKSRVEEDTRSVSSVQPICSINKERESSCLQKGKILKKPLINKDVPVQSFVVDVLET